MQTRFWIFLAASGAVWAQQVVAPTTETLGTPLGEDHGSYNVTNSFETGYRFSLVGGDLGEYRSDVNYRNGLRLLGSSVSIDSKDGHGHYFDQVLSNTSPAGQQRVDRFQGRARALLRPDSAEHDGAGQRSVPIRGAADSEERVVSLRHDVAAERSEEHTSELQS